MSNLTNAIRQARVNAMKRDEITQEQAKQTLKDEFDSIAQQIQVADAAGKNSIQIGTYLSNSARYALEKEGCTVMRIERGYNPSTHDPMFVGYQISW